MLFLFLFGRHRIHGLTAASGVKQHSRDVYHGSFVAVCAVLVPLIVLLAWSGLSPLLIDAMLEDFLRRQSPELSIGEMGVLIAKVKAYFAGSLPRHLLMTLFATALIILLRWWIIPPRHAALLSVGSMWCGAGLASFGAAFYRAASR